MGNGFRENLPKFKTYKASKEDEMKAFIQCKNSHLSSLRCGVERVSSTWGPRWSPWPVFRFFLSIESMFWGSSILLWTSFFKRVQTSTAPTVLPVILTTRLFNYLRCGFGATAGGGWRHTGRTASWSSSWRGKHFGLKSSSEKKGQGLTLCQ